jgi:hypothetical protein
MRLGPSCARTSIIVSHWISTVRDADRILPDRAASLSADHTSCRSRGRNGGLHRKQLPEEELPRHDRFNVDEPPGLKDTGRVGLAGLRMSCVSLWLLGR